MGLVSPTQRIAVNEAAQCSWRSHAVAIQVGNVTDSDIDIALIDVLGRFIDVDEELVVTSHMTEIKVSQNLVRLHGCTLTLVDMVI